eukprot:2623222-Pyramimonas_sp.AAC.1
MKQTGPEPRRRARGGSEKEKAFSGGGGASQKPPGLLRGFLFLGKKTCQTDRVGKQTLYSDAFFWPCPDICTRQRIL